jgi:hypothetical protein
MAEADRDDTSSQGEWVSPREYVRHIARDPAAETEAEYSITELFRRGKIPYCYRAGNGALHRDDLADDFRREAVIDFAKATATRPGRTICEDNSALPLVRRTEAGNLLRPKPQWIGHPLLQRDWDPFSRDPYIQRELPAETITELQFLVPRAVRKHAGKEWIKLAYDRKADKFRSEGANITNAARELAEDSKAATDCARPLKCRYIESELRLVGHWLKKPRKPQRQRPK